SGSTNCPDSQWPAWEIQKIANPADRSGKSANLFGLYKTPEERRSLINRLQRLEVTTYRFSVEWSHLQPQKDSPINKENLQVYVDLCKQLRDAGIHPSVTLHHFSEPLWFHQMGSFEKEENIDCFVEFAEAVFTALTVSYQGQPLVEQFYTINEPAIEAFSRYVMGSFSCSPADPQARGATLVGKIFELFARHVLGRLTTGTILNFNRAGHFLRGALRAHSKVYERLKSKNDLVQIGIVHQYLQFIPARPLLVPVTKYFTHLINKTSLHYFKTGEFNLKMPFCHIASKDPIPKTDFVGLQYYVRPVIGLTGSTGYHEPMTLMPFREDPEGLYEAITETYSHVNKPIVIT
ncbi:MAG: family 1 glycosylhydrolase, partial [Rhabdochlamydiaceae bacterium]